MLYIPNNSFLDPYQPISDHGKKIPHWYQAEKFQFITFRLADALPSSVVQHLKAYIANSHKSQHESEILYKRMLQKYLDRGYGECLLRNKECRKIIIEALNYSTEMECYDIVIMPNHIHFLATFSGNHRKIMENIKRFTARRINEHLKRRGHLWQTDFWDRMIRNETHLLNTRAYIYNNPRHLPHDQYTLIMGGEHITR